MASERTHYRDGHGDDWGPPSEYRFVWVSLHDPGREELMAVQHEFALAEPVVAELSRTAMRPSLEVAGQVVVAAVKTASWAPSEEAVRLGTIRLVLGERFVISVDDDATVLEQVRHDLQTDLELSGAGPAAALPCVVDQAVEGFGPVLAAINTAVEEVEDAVFNPGRLRPTERIYNLSRQVLALRRVMGPLIEMLDRLAHESPTPTGEQLRRRFREQRAHLQHLIETVDGVGDLLSNMLQAHLTQVSVHQNDDMRRISAWVAIWAVPTLLAGIYGMNFRHMPELDWRFGYPLVVVVMLVICLALRQGFRRTGGSNHSATFSMLLAATAVGLLCTAKQVARSITFGEAVVGEPPLASLWTAELARRER